uniref:Synaptotagmin-like protein 2 n=1 Tax=Tetraodon nigroviridis TaxID=99883 RepID=H3C3P9_TETNG
MIDLSFLTEEEQEIIQEVLKRDELKKAEEQRIRNLQKTVSDRGLLRYLTGEWFYETKQRRHRERIHSADIIRASMRQAQRPPTTRCSGLTQTFSEKLPVVICQKEDIFIPPIACGTLQAVHGQHIDESCGSFTAHGRNHVTGWQTVPDASKGVVQSPPKQRKNPFNSEAEDENHHRLNGTVEDESLNTPSTSMHNVSVPPSVAENTAVSISRPDCPAEADRPGGEENNTRLSTASSTDLPAHEEPQSPLVSSTKSWKERKREYEMLRSGHKFLGLLREENDKTKEAENTKSLSQGATNEEDDEPDVLVEVQRLQRTLVEETASANGEASHGPAVSSGSPTDTAPVPSSQTLHNPPEEGNLSAPLPFFAVGSTTVEVSQQKVEEHTEQPPVSSTVLWTPSVDSRAMPKGEGQRSPPKTNYFLPRSPERSPLSSPDHQHRVKAQVQERPPSPAKSDSPKLKRQKEDVRRSPSKTCHPRVLPRESTSPQAPRIPGSPLKTFPINIDPQIPEEHLGRPTPMPRQRRSPSHQTKQAVLADTKNISEIPSPAAPQPTRVSEESLPSLEERNKDHQQTDSDSTFEASRQRRNTSSSVSNFSLSSGLNSMSSMSSSISSIFPADGGDLEVRGSLQFAVNYIQKLAEFHVFVVNCRDLAVADVKKKRSDPYVKCYLLPDQLKLGKRKTTVKKKTSHPTFNEILRFKILLEELKTQNLNMSVWHNDTFGRNSFLGEVDVDLSEWDFGNTQINEYALQARASAQPSPLPDQRLVDNRGQMRVAVRFLPQTSHSERNAQTGEVQIWVKDCKNLPPVRGVTIDPFVKCAVLPDTSRKSRQKTRVVKRTSSPMFNHTMVYDGFRTEDLREACVEITVWDHDRLHHHFVGGLRLGLGTGKSYGVDVAWMDSTSDEADLWQRMLQSVGEWVEDILPLRMLMMAKLTK